LESINFRVENIHEGVTGDSNALVLVVYTIENKIHFCLHYCKPTFAEEEIKKNVSNAMSLLNKVVSQ